jgi:hypothetical protein
MEWFNDISLLACKEKPETHLKLKALSVEIKVMKLLL